MNTKETLQDHGLRLQPLLRHDHLCVTSWQSSIYMILHLVGHNMTSSSWAHCDTWIFLKVMLLIPISPTPNPLGTRVLQCRKFPTPHLLLKSLSRRSRTIQVCFPFFCPNFSFPFPLVGFSLPVVFQVPPHLLHLVFALGVMLWVTFGVGIGVTIWVTVRVGIWVIFGVGIPEGFEKYFMLESKMMYPLTLNMLVRGKGDSIRG